MATETPEATAQEAESAEETPKVSGKHSAEWRALEVQMKAITSGTDLFKLAQSDEFLSAVDGLSDDEQEDLRDLYEDLRKLNSDRIKLSELAGKDLHVTYVRVGYSEKYANDFVVIKGTTQKDNKPFEAISSSKAVYGFFSRYSGSGLSIMCRITQGEAPKEGQNPPWVVTPMAKLPKRVGVPF